MRSFFSKLGGNAPKTVEGSRSVESDLPALLAKAADLLKKLRSATQEDFPLLNEATRHGIVKELPVACTYFCCNKNHLGKKQDR